MKKIIISTILMATCLVVNAQSERKDWAKFYRYEQANDTIKTKPRAVFMGMGYKTYNKLVVTSVGEAQITGYKIGLGLYFTAQ